MNFVTRRELFEDVEIAQSCALMRWVGELGSEKEETHSVEH